MSFLFRLAVYVPVLYLIALVVIGQFHSTAHGTLRGAAQRTLRWLGWSAVLVVSMWALAYLLIGW